MLEDDQTGSSQRFALLGSIPVLGVFFRNNSVNRQETELLILVSPEMVHPLEQEQLPLLIPGMEVTEPNEFAFYWKGQIEGDEGCNFRSTVVYNQWVKVREAVREASDCRLPALRAILRCRTARLLGLIWHSSFSFTWLRTFVMTIKHKRCEPLAWAVVLAGSLGLASCGTPSWKGLFQNPPGPAPIGTISDQYWSQQEINGEGWKNIIFQHEFKKNGVRLNWAGEDHVKQIAAQINRNPDFKVVIERSTMTADPTAKYKFPVNLNPELDMKRREMVVQALLAMGVPDASERVVVGPDLPQV